MILAKNIDNDIKNYGTMLFFIKTNIFFSYHCNAIIDIAGIRSAAMELLYHQNLFLEMFSLVTNEIVYFQH